MFSSFPTQDFKRKLDRQIRRAPPFSREVPRPTRPRFGNLAESGDSIRLSAGDPRDLEGNAGFLFVFASGCGSKIGIQNGTLVETWTTCGPIPGGLILTHSQVGLTSLPELLEF